ncbi:Outer membrane protein beta-barrel domain-containing protein [Flavobacterium swingsii]|uniref:Outer membrane protein beta-barrel domain-containing protein n=1 Tax=Flavobacterium swingsii TaxID=498292 RepID=A0A1I0WV77_9FLAO|nr:outer membrane beta-barrel protein [Flavobacterium swingsii]SFA92682.1 Outer membrane protein beta-barrel domain-containing protein [Flavobacterium swingsii]
MKKFKNPTIVSVFLCILLLCCSNYAVAQEKWKIAFRPGIDFSNKNFSDTQHGIGYGLEATISYRFQKYLSAFAGWSFNSFPAKESFAGNNGEFDESGYNFGFQFTYPIASSKFNYVIGAGGTYNHIEIEDYKRNVIANSDYGFGWQVEAGFSYTIVNRFDIMPTIRYRSLSRDIMIGSDKMPINLNYISVGAGMIWSF